MRALQSLVSLLALSAILTMVGCTAEPDGDGEYVACTEPAPLLGEFDANAPGYIVVFEDDVDSTEEASRLAGEYPIEVISVYEYALSGFYALMSEETVERVRCEATVAHVSYNASGTLGARTTSVPREP